MHLKVKILLNYKLQNEDSTGNVNTCKIIYNWPNLSE